MFMLLVISDLESPTQTKKAPSIREANVWNLDVMKQNDQETLGENC